MKVILSRKGFDKNNGGIASPILQDGTLISLPIPSIYGRPYADMYYKEQSYADILKSLGYKQKCQLGHLDPDIRADVFSADNALWRPMLGQLSSAQGVLRNRNVGVGDFFLFFGMFQEVDANFHYLSGTLPKHVIYGYLEIGKVVSDPNEIKKYTWHPHSGMMELTNNTIYLAADILSFNHNLPGAGVLNHSEDLVLNKKDAKWYIWDENRFPFLMEEHLCHSKRTFKPSNGGIMIADKTGQEFVYSESDELSKWLKTLLS